MPHYEQSADFDAGPIVRAQQFAFDARGTAMRKVHLQEKLFDIYRTRNGRIIPVTKVYDAREGNLDGSERMNKRILKSMEGAKLEVQGVTLEMFEKHWDHNNDGALWTHHEAIDAVSKILPNIVADTREASAELRRNQSLRRPYV